MYKKIQQDYVRHNVHFSSFIASIRRRWPDRRIIIIFRLHTPLNKIRKINEMLGNLYLKDFLNWISMYFLSRKKSSQNCLGCILQVALLSYSNHTHSHNNYHIILLHFFHVWKRLHKRHHSLYKYIIMFDTQLTDLINIFNIRNGFLLYFHISFLLCLLLCPRHWFFLVDFFWD